jgi:ATP phosphoribosyltransferase regulatory subunit
MVPAPALAAERASMNDPDTTALLPAGLRDILPPDADFAAEVIERLRTCFARYGYDWVVPPLVEFEDTLFDGAGAAMAQDTFRLMDPVSQRMMGLRTDITVQVARIATTRLAKVPRPLRLAYAGEVLRVKGKQLRPERQFTQIGAELIGSSDPLADVEAVVVAIDGLTRLGVKRLSVDLTVPPLVARLLSAFDAAPRDAAAIRMALDRKDAAAVAQAAAPLGAEGGVFAALLRASGAAEPALAELGQIRLPEAARLEAERLSTMAHALATALPETAFTVDPVENRGLEYHTGVCFTILRAGVRGELGLGGRYLAGHTRLPAKARGAKSGGAKSGKGELEPATGFTLYLDPILRALPAPQLPERVYLPYGTAPETAAGLRDKGHRTVAGLSPEPNGDAAAEARRLACSHYWTNGKVAPVPAPADAAAKD